MAAARYGFPAFTTVSEYHVPMTKAIVLACALLVLVASSCGSGAQPSPTSTVVLHILEAVAERNVSAVQQHLDGGTDINGSFVRDPVPGFGGYPLHSAVLVGYIGITELLLQSGAHINIRARDQNGGTPLHWAAFLGNRQMAELLVEAGADINSTDYDGYTPLDAAVSNPDLAPKTKLEISDFLRKNGAKTKD